MAEEEGFTVGDRRTGASDAGAEQPQSGAAGAQQTENAALGQRQEAKPTRHWTFPPSLSPWQQRQVNLGAMPHPKTNQTSQNFPGGQADDRHPRDAEGEDEGEPVQSRVDAA